ncbi:MAG TPA: hypothetical protein VFQ23_22660 [Anaerolineales bacterium]|nr:hypothetical protein [Anaerolineales bacterium]
MRTIKSSFRLVTAIFLIAILVSIPAPAKADHSFLGLHWPREENPFRLRFGDNVSSGWDSHLRETAEEWSESRVLNLRVVEGSTTGRRCIPRQGRVEVCSFAYGDNGILYTSTVFFVDDHILGGIIQLNDTYLNSAPFNTRPWRRYILCQQIGFTLGLDYQDVDPFNTNNGSCNDLTDNPAGPPRNTKPNRHDFDMLKQIYSHSDGDDDLALTSVLSPSIDAGAMDTTAMAASDGNSGVYITDLGNGMMTVTLVGRAK